MSFIKILLKRIHSKFSVEVVFTCLLSAFISQTYCSKTKNTSSDSSIFQVEKGKISLSSSDTNLVKSFQWAKNQALAYVFEGDPVGDWYEAALPKREAFCMRDVSHQSMGANALGLQPHNLNMLRRFAENISESKDWCTYWEINRYNKPAPVDYRNDEEFWYNLPANFDVLDCCWRQYLWTGDKTYIQDSVFLNFYKRTVYDYVERWDLSIDKIMQRSKNMNLSVPLDLDDYYRTCRGLPSYDESDYNILVGADLLAAMFAGYRAYANIQEKIGDIQEKANFSTKAEDVKNFLNDIWWNNEEKTFKSFYYGEGNFKIKRGMRSLIYYGIAEKGEKSQTVLDNLIQKKMEVNIEEQSHFPEIFYDYGKNDEAYQLILHLADEKTKRREYPEVSFALIGTIVNGLMGIEPNAVENVIYTLPRLTEQTDWVEVKNVPVLNHEIDVRHVGLNETTLLNNSKSELTWIARFPGEHDVLLINGKEKHANSDYLIDQKISWIKINVKSNASSSVKTNQ
jgi:hypothetical protein